MTRRSSSGALGARIVRGAVVLALAALATYLYADGVREFRFLSDDAFISYRYSRNVFEGHGLVWNVGEPPVEGYTSFLWIWVGVLAFHLGLEPQVLSTAITIASGALILALLYVFLGRRRGFLHPIAAIAPLCLAMNRTFVAWSTGGLATQFFSLSVLVSALWFLHERKRSPAWPVGSALLFAFTTLVRPEGILFAFSAGCILLHDAVVSKRRSWSGLFTWVGVYFAVVGAHFLWRHWTYGYWFPNTYYAKVTDRLRAWDGLEYVGLYLYEYLAIPELGKLTWASAAGFGALLFVPAVLRRRAEDFLFLLFVLVFTAYVIWVGGDWMEFRFLNVVLPYLYLSIVEGLGVLMRHLAGPRPIDALVHERLGTAKLLPASWLPQASHLIKAAAGVAVLLLLSLTYRTTLRTDAEMWSRGNVKDVRKEMRVYTSIRTQQGQALREWVERGLLPADLRIAVGGSGALPYYSRLYTIDLLGWNDVVVAHGPIVKPGLIGHEHEASPEYLREKGVELIDTGDNFVTVVDPRELPRRAERYCFTGERTAYEVQPGAYVVFGTYLDDEELEQRLGHLERVY